MMALPPPPPRPLVVAIVGHTKDHAIGYHNFLAVENKLDMKVFKTLTTGHAVVMGYKTLKSLPGGKPLPKRSNHVMVDAKRSPEAVDGVQFISSIHGLVNIDATEYLDDSILWVIGGAATYSNLLEHCDYVLACNNDVEFSHPDLVRWDYSFRKNYTKDLLEIDSTPEVSTQARLLTLPKYRQPLPEDCSMSLPTAIKFKYTLYFNANARTNTRSRHRVFEEKTLSQIQELLDQA